MADAVKPYPARCAALTVSAKPVVGRVPAWTGRFEPVDATRARLGSGDVRGCHLQVFAWYVKTSGPRSTCSSTTVRSSSSRHCARASGERPDCSVASSPTAQDGLRPPRCARRPRDRNSVLRGRAAHPAGPGDGITPSCCSIPSSSRTRQCSTMRPSTIRSMLIMAMLTCRPVGGSPRNSPRCVPRTVVRVTTRSPSAIWSSIV